MSFSPYDNVCFHAVFIQPFHLRINRCDTNATTYEYKTLILTFLVSEMYEL